MTRPSLLRGCEVANTPLRTVRVPDELWSAAREVAAARGTTLTAVVNRALVELVGLCSCGLPASHLHSPEGSKGWACRVPG